MYNSFHYRVQVRYDKYWYDMSLEMCSKLEFRRNVLNKMRCGSSNTALGERWWL